MCFVCHAGRFVFAYALATVHKSMCSPRVVRFVCLPVGVQMASSLGQLRQALEGHESELNGLTEDVKRRSAEAEREMADFKDKVREAAPNSGLF